jgi:hypothetical protein
VIGLKKYKATKIMGLPIVSNYAWHLAENFYGFLFRVIYMKR